MQTDTLPLESSFQNIFHDMSLKNNVIAVGFSSPAESFREKTLDLTQYIIKHPAATFLMRVEGQSMIGVGIYPDDILVVDRSLTPHFGRVVVVVLDGELLIKRLVKKENHISLEAADQQTKPIIVKVPEFLNIWGVVTCVIHHL